MRLAGVSIWNLARAGRAKSAMEMNVENIFVDIRVFERVFEKGMEKPESVKTT